MLFFKKKKQKECEPLEGGGFRVSYVDDGVEIFFCHVPIDAQDSDYDDIYIPKKDGYTFDGWYYDEAFTNKLEITNTIHLPRTPIYDENNCHIGYKNITLYAKWIKNE